MQLDEIDITLVAGSRPDLLSKTLQSFNENMFGNFSIGCVYVNIDPIMGTEADRLACVDLIKGIFPNAIIQTPQTASFGQAVKSLWQQTGDRVVFHLEDDWLLNEPLTPEKVFPLFEEDVGMVQPAIEPRSDSSEDFFTMIKRKRILGFEISRKIINSYGTSPRFFCPGLAKTFGNLLNPRMDPEK